MNIKVEWIQQTSSCHVLSTLTGIVILSIYKIYDEWHCSHYQYWEPTKSPDDAKKQVKELYGIELLTK